MKKILLTMKLLLVLAVIVYFFVAEDPLEWMKFIIFAGISIFICWDNPSRKRWGTSVVTAGVSLLIVGEWLFQHMTVNLLGGIVTAVSMLVMVVFMVQIELKLDYEHEKFLFKFEKNFYNLGQLLFFGGSCSLLYLHTTGANWVFLTVYWVYLFMLIWKIESRTHFLVLLIQFTIKSIPLILMSLNLQWLGVGFLLVWCIGSFGGIKYILRKLQLL